MTDLIIEPCPRCGGVEGNCGRFKEHETPGNEQQMWARVCACGYAGPSVSVTGLMTEVPTYMSQQLHRDCGIAWNQGLELRPRSETLSFGSVILAEDREIKVSLDLSIDSISHAQIQRIQGATFVFTEQCGEALREYCRELEKVLK